MLHVFCLNVADDWRVHITIKAYYDGSADLDKSFMTLTGLAAPESVWAKFEADWDACLTAHHVYEDFHMTDFMAGVGYWSSFDDREKQQLITDLFTVFGRNRDSRLRAYSCTVLLQEYEKAKLAIPKLRLPEAICVDFCVGGLQLTEQELSISKPILLYFDRDEPFMHMINRVWERAPGRANYGGTRRGWPYQIRKIVPVNRSHIPIQAADFLGWSENRQYCDPDDPMTQVFMLCSMFMVEHFTRVYHCAEIIRRYPNG